MLRIPNYQEVQTNRKDARLTDGRTVGEHLDQARNEFIRMHKGAFIHTGQALDFVRAKLPYLPTTEQAAVANELVSQADRLTNWGPGRGLTSEHQRQREQSVRATIDRFVSEQRGDLGVEDLARSLKLQLSEPKGLDGARDGAVLNLGTHLVISSELPPIAAHQPREGVKLDRGWVTREGDELAFTGLIPAKNGYLQVQTRIDAESDGPLTARERSAIDALASTLGHGLGAELIPTRHFGSVEGVRGRPFDQQRALADGTYIRVPTGEGVAQHTLIDGRPASSSFSVGPAFYSISHGGPAYPAFSFPNRTSDGSSFQVTTIDNQTTLQVAIPLPKGNHALAWLGGQPSLEAARGQVANVIALTREIFCT